MNDKALYTRQSTLLELSRTRPGRLFSNLIAMQAKKDAPDKKFGDLYAGATGYVTLEKLVFSSQGQLSWGMVDGILDLANGNYSNFFKRILRRGNKPDDKADQNT